MFGFSKPKKSKPPRIPFLEKLSGQGIKAFYDGADISSVDQNHFRQATSANADTQASKSRRERARNNARYEVENNNYLKGMLRAFRNDVIGRVPRIRILLGQLLEGKVGSKEIRRYSSAIEWKWCLWAQEIRLGRKLRTMVKDRVVAGAAFAMIKTNLNVPGPIKLDLKLIDADRIGNPEGVEFHENPNVVDGIEFDDCDRPLRFFVYKYHPGDIRSGGNFEGEWVEAKNMLYWFTLERSEQHIGVSEIQGSLAPASGSRRWRNATLKAIESAASVSGFIHTDIQADDDDEDAAGVLPYDEIPWPHDSFVGLPDSWRASQMRAEHPTAAYKDLHEQTSTEQGRPLGIHRAKATGDASNYNFASVQYDDQDYKVGTGIERYDICYDLDRLAAEWWAEAVLVEDYLPMEVRQLIGPDDYPQLPPHEWRFDSRGHVDPLKEANAAGKRIETGQSSPADEIKRNGQDAEEVLEEAARFFGVTVEEYQQLLREKIFSKKKNEKGKPDGDQDETEESTEEESRSRRKTQSTTSG